MDTNAPPTAPPPPPPVPPHRVEHLRRDRANGMLGGVAAGITRTYGIDVVIVRVLLVVAGVLWIGVPAYIVAWIAVPSGDAPVDDTARRRDPKMIVGLALVALGALIAGNRVLPQGFHFGHLGFPVFLIGGGIAILLLRRRDDIDPQRGAADPESVPAPPERPAFVTSPVSESPQPDESPTQESPSQESPSQESPSRSAEPDATSREKITQPLAGPLVPAAPPVPVPPSAWTQNGPWPAPPSTDDARTRRRAWRDERRAQRQRSFLTPITLSVLLIGAGIASLLQAGGALDVNITVVLAIATCVVGAALVVSAFVGRARLLIFVGLLLVAATGVSNTLDVPLRGGIGHHEFHPLQLADVQDRYALGIGDLQLDLRDVPLADRTTVVNAQNGIGELEVLVPSTVRVEVDAHVGAGSLMLFGRDNGGWPENDTRAIDGSGSGVLHLDLKVGAGQVSVRRFEPGGVETAFATGGQG